MLEKALPAAGTLHRICSEEEALLRSLERLDVALLERFNHRDVEGNGNQDGASRTAELPEDSIELCSEEVRIHKVAEPAESDKRGSGVVEEVTEQPVASRVLGVTDFSANGVLREPNRQESEQNLSFIRAKLKPTMRKKGQLPGRIRRGGGKTNVMQEQEPRSIWQATTRGTRL